MSRKRQKKHAKPVPQVPAPRLRVNAMDLFRAQDAASKEVLRRVAKTVDGYDNFVSRLGLNNDNALSGGTYEFNLVTRNRILLEAAYRGSWIVGQVVDAVAEDMTRAGIDISTNEADADIKDFQSAMSRLQIWKSTASNIKWGRLYGGSLGVMQVEGQDLASPLRLDTIGKGQFKGLVVYDRWQLNPVLTPVVQSGPEMGLPEFYQIVNNPSGLDPTAPTATGMQKVHHSRCVRYTGIDLPYFQAITEMMWGESVLERLWDRLISFDNATLSCASLIDRASLRTIGIDGLREIIGAGGEAQAGLEAQFEMMRAMQVNEGLTLLDKEDEFTSTAYSFAGLSDMMLQFGQQLSGASGIPLVRLFGQSPAGLNATGEGELRTYYDNINAQQEARLRRPFETLLRVMWRSVFGKPAPEDLEFTFTPLWQMSATDKATVAKSNTETVLGAYEGGLVSRAGAMKDLRQMSGDTGLFSNISDDEIEEAENDPPPPLPGDPPATPGQAPGAEPGKPPGEAGEGPVKALDSRWGKLKRWVGLGRDAKEFKESEHPRKDDGKFGKGSGGGSKGSEKKPASEKSKEKPSESDKRSAGYEIRKPANAESESEREVVLPDGSTESFSSEEHAKKYVQYLERKKGPLPESKTERVAERIKEAGQDLTIRGVRKQDVYSSLQKIQIGEKHYEIPQTYVWFHDEHGELVDKVGGERDDDNSTFASEQAEKELKERLGNWMKREGLDDEFEARIKLGEKRSFAVAIQPKDRAPYEVKKKK